jgi:outer membrane receptor protein involved in Fe transport
MNRITIIFSVLLFLFSFSVHAQQEEKKQEIGKITGRVIDSASGEAVEYAAVSLQRMEDGKVVNGATADEKGIFKLENVAEGNYKLIIDFIGYQKKENKNIVVSKENPTVILKDIKLSGKQKVLKEVTIAAEKSVIENKIDKMVYNVDKDVTSQGGVATDVLKKIPQVDVDVDGNVELQGNANIRFLINGKPSVIFGNNIADVLQSIPSSQIQSIEIITSPGAKYDAEGTGGIINIILKKSTAQGINGNVSVSAGTRLENGSFNLNARKGKFGVHANFNGNAMLTSSTVNQMTRKSTDTTSTTILTQNGNTDLTRRSYQGGFGFDWDLNDKNSVSGSVGIGYYGVVNDGGAGRTTLARDGFGNTLSNVHDSLLTNSYFKAHWYNAEISYKKKFKKEDQELEILLNTSTGLDVSYFDQTQEFISPVNIYNGSYGNNPSTQSLTNVEINYTHPLPKDVTIETGAKLTMDHDYNVNDIYLLNLANSNYDYSTSQSSTMDFFRTIYAGYLSVQFKLFKFLDVKAGSRYEYTQANADFSNSGNMTFAPYNTLAPSAIISHKFKKEQMLKLGYTHRIQRPDYGDMNPFVNATDPKNISTGNPNLLPEIGDKVELSYSQPVAKKGNFSATLFMRNNTNDIQWYTYFYPTYKVGDSTYSNVAVRVRENIGHEDNYGLNLFASVPFGEKLNIRTNLSGFERYIFSGISSTADVHGFNYRANLNITYQLSPTLVLEAFGNFNSPRINAQGTMPSFTTYNFAFRKQLFHKNASIAFTATNFFNEYVNQKTSLTGDNFTLENLRQLPYRSFGINFTYKFGHLEFKKEKEAEDPNLTNPPGN